MKETLEMLSEYGWGDNDIFDRSGIHEWLRREYDISTDVNLIDPDLVGHENVNKCLFISYITPHIREQIGVRLSKNWGGHTESEKESLMIRFATRVVQFINDYSIKKVEWEPATQHYLVPKYNNQNLK